MGLTNNDIIRRLRYTFDYNDDKMMAIFKHGGLTIDRATFSSWLKKEADKDFVKLRDVELASFLNGFIIEKRGKKNDEIPVAERILNNNIIFRKIKIALSFKDTDILDAFDLADLHVSKHELSAIFRKPEQRQYRACQDQFLRNFLQGLQLKYRKNN